MSRTTREINLITTTIISLSGKLLFFALVLFLLYEGITRGYHIGYEIFSPTAMEEAPGTDKEIVIEEGESLSDVAAKMEEEGLISSRMIFVIQAKIYEYEIHPGTYQFNTSETSKDMLRELDEAASAEKAAEEGGSE